MNACIESKRKLAELQVGDGNSVDLNVDGVESRETESWKKRRVESCKFSGEEERRVFIAGDVEGSRWRETLDLQQRREDQYR